MLLRIFRRLTATRLGRLRTASIVALAASLAVLGFSPPSQTSLSFSRLTEAAAPAPDSYRVDGQTVYRGTQSITLNGINWFGFETPTHVVQGLWARNWHDMISQSKDLGFNAMRIPVCPATLAGVDTSTVDYSLNPDLKGLNSRQALNLVLNELDKQDVYFILDYHSLDCGGYQELWYTPDHPESEWIANLQDMSTSYAGLHHFVGIDLKNEPHYSVTWGTGNPATDWNLAAERGGRAVLAANPNLLVFVQGIDQKAACTRQDGNWWGGNLQPFSCTPISTQAIPADKLVLSPHLYGPSQADQPYFHSSTWPSNLITVYDRQFGFLVDRGIAVIPDEWGGLYGPDAVQETQLLDTLTAYMASKGMCSSFYWALNPNSEHIGGILQADWKTPEAGKMAMLQTYRASCAAH